MWNFAKDSIAYMVLNVVFALGFFILLFASFCIDHFSLFGLSQAFNTDISAALRISTKSTGAASQHLRVIVPPAIADCQNPLAGLTTRGLYSVVAHPIMTGMLMGKHAPSRPITALFNSTSSRTLGCTHNDRLPTPPRLLHHRVPRGRRQAP